MKHSLFAALAALCLMASCSSQPATSAYESILSRTSIRQYMDRPLSDEQVNSLLRAGMSAPSARNCQPWEFVVIRSAETRQAIADSIPSARMAAQAPVVIAVCGNMLNTLEGANQSYWIEDCSAATENILLAAHSMGLGAVWCGIRPSEERSEVVSQLLALPSYVHTLCLICIGYPAEQPEPKDKWNTDKIHREQW